MTQSETIIMRHRFSGVQSWDRWKYFDKVDFLVWIKDVTFTEVWYDSIEL
jgi:hypothetical protein